MKIENAKYSKDIISGKDSVINCTINGEHWCIPISENNTDYQEIKKQLDAGTLTIEASD